MSDGRDSQFTKVFLIVTAVVSLGLIVLGYMAYSRFSDVSQRYNTNAAELKRLQALVPYPSAPNLAKVQDEKKAYMEAITNVQGTLSQLEFPLDPITPEGFQDKLRATVSAITARATENKTKLPPKFYLGFDKYQSEPPLAEMASALSRQLDAIAFVAQTLIDDKADAILSIQRTPLPGEVASRTVGKPVPAGDKSNLVRKFPFTISFIGEQSKLRKAVDDIVKTDKQFYIVRALRVKNQRDKPPSRSGGIGGGEDLQTVLGSGAETKPESAGTQQLHFIVGNELTQFDLRLETVDFAEPSPSPSPSPGRTAGN
jgi:hypothetical protein